MTKIHNHPHLRKDAPELDSGELPEFIFTESCEQPWQEWVYLGFHKEHQCITQGAIHRENANLYLEESIEKQGLTAAYKEMYSEFEYGAWYECRADYRFDKI